MMSPDSIYHILILRFRCIYNYMHIIHILGRNSIKPWGAKITKLNHPQSRRWSHRRLLAVGGLVGSWFKGIPKLGSIPPKRPGGSKMRWYMPSGDAYQQYLMTWVQYLFSHTHGLKGKIAPWISSKTNLGGHPFPLNHDCTRKRLPHSFSNIYNFVTPCCHLLPVSWG